jgi:hypothetical protein
LIGSEYLTNSFDSILLLVVVEFLDDVGLSLLPRFVIDGRIDGFPERADLLEREEVLERREDSPF